MTERTRLHPTADAMSPRRTVRRAVSVTTALLCLTALSGCNLWDRLANAGAEPKLAATENPKNQDNYRQVTTPLPPPQVAERVPGSLWRPGAKAFFRDNRAQQVGDIVTVVIFANDSATLSNDSGRTRGGAESLAVPNLLGFTDADAGGETELRGWLPRTFNPAAAVNVTSSGSTTNTADIQRQEQIRMRVAAIVTQVLPNGNMVVYGRQQVRVNYELREMTVSGILRPEDISTNNAIALDLLAEARVAYGGKGFLSDVQSPRYGQEILDILLPF